MPAKGPENAEWRREIARKAGRASARKKTAKQLREDARAAAIARWSRLTPEQRREWRRNRPGKYAVRKDQAA